MPIKLLVTSDNLNDVSSIKVGESNILSTLGKKEDSIAVQLQELFESVTEALVPVINSDSQLTVEVSGSLTLKAQAGVKYLFFNVGGESSNSGMMKVSLSTTIKTKTIR